MKKETIEKIEKLLSLPENQKYKNNLEKMNLLELQNMRSLVISIMEFGIRLKLDNEEAFQRRKLDVKAYDYYIEKRMKESSLK